MANHIARERGSFGQCAVGAGSLFALFGGGLIMRGRNGEALAIVVLLPFGAAYLLYKSLTRRWRVLKGSNQPM